MKPGKKKEKESGKKNEELHDINYQQTTTNTSTTNYIQDMKAIQQSEAKWKSLALHAPNYITIVDKDHKITYINHPVPGLTVNDVVGKSVYDFIHPEFHDLARTMINSVFETGKPVSYESVAVGAGGTLSTYVNSLGPIIVDGKITEVSLIGSDVTEQRLVEAKLENTIEMLHFSQEAANIGTWWLSLPDNVLHWTPQVFRIFGITHYSKVPTMEEFYTFIVPEDLDFVRQKGEEQFNKNDTVTRYIYHIKRKDGHIRTLEHIGRQIRDIKDNIIQLIGTIQDITSRKQIEQSLKESEERFKIAAEKYRAAFQESRDAISILTKDYHIIDANKQMLELSEYSLEEIISLDLSTLYAPGFKEQMIKHLRSLMKGEILPVFEIEMLTKSGTGIPVEVGVALMANCYERDIVFQSTIRDISKRKKTESALQNIQKLESLGVLAGGIAHDFNNLLGGIFGYIDLALENLKDKKISRYLSLALNTIDRARGLTQQLLTFSKGGSPVIKTEGLFPFIKETVQFALSGSKISCMYDIAHDLWSCQFDRNQIAQVIDNIIINAQQAMPGGGMIYLSAYNIQGNKIPHPHINQGNYVGVSIRDTGIGIPDNIRERIFDPFFSTKEMGHGLGLAVCYSIIKRHNGWIDFISESGTGTTFNFYLPAVIQKMSSGTGDITHTHRGSGIILIMDDEKTIRESMDLMLSSFGYTIICTSNGEETVEYTTEAISSNKKMTGMMLDLTISGGIGGKEIIDTIRTMDYELPVIVMSGYAEDPIMAHPEKYGFTASLRKPFTRAELIKILNTFFV